MVKDQKGCDTMLGSHERIVGSELRKENCPEVVLSCQCEVNRKRVPWFGKGIIV